MFNSNVCNVTFNLSGLLNPSTAIGLNARERNEFIMYWLPILEKNEHNLVYFELTKEREKYNKLNISPKVDSLLRVAIHVKKVDGPTYIKEEKLEITEPDQSILEKLSELNQETENSSDSITIAELISSF